MGEGAGLLPPTFRAMGEERIENQEGGAGEGGCESFWGGETTSGFGGGGTQCLVEFLLM